jgi:hypothetical protein
MSAHERMKRYRAKQRAAGLRLVRLRVPDTRAPAFVAECQRQARLLQGDPVEAVALAFIEQAADWDNNARH